MRGATRVPRRCAAFAAACSLTGAVTLGLFAAAPAAVARDVPGGMEVSPSAAAPGSTVSFFVTACTATATAATATSTAFENVTLKPGDGGLIGTTKVKSVSVGSYSVSVSCAGGGTVSTMFDVLDKNGGSGSSPGSAQQVRPSGPTKAGLGGSQGVDAARVALGAVLAAGAAGAIVHGVRRSRAGA